MTNIARHISQHEQKDKQTLLFVINALPLACINLALDEQVVAVQLPKIATASVYIYRKRNQTRPLSLCGCYGHYPTTKGDVV